ncbi:MAG: ATP-binding protein [Betaproteobacteria bacterium]
MPFRDVVGHRRLVVLIARSVERGSLPPSLLFAGPAGVGKRMVALATAQALNCTNPRESHASGAGRMGPPRAPAAAASERSESRRRERGWGPASSEEASVQGGSGGDEVPPDYYDACGTCAACSRIARGVHPDVLIVEPGETGAIKIDQVRDVIDRTAYRPFEGRRRVVIVDEADALVVQAQNALLKTLEEPPSSSVFILVTPRPDVLLPTVLSRCPRLMFRPLSDQDVAAALMARGTPEADARAVASRAGGSLRAALDASAEDLRAVRDVAGRLLMRAAASDDPRRRIECAQELLAKTTGAGSADRAQVASYLRAVSTLLRDVELLSTGADARALANADLRPVLEKLSRAYGGDRGMRAFQAVDRALVALERNAGVKVVADWIALEI